MKLLIIEDEMVTATDLKRTLEKKGHQVLPICKSYNEAMSVLQENTPDLLLMDIRLANSSKDGIQIAGEIKRDLGLPVVYLTSQTDHETFERAKHTSPAAYLFKPFRHDELVFQLELAYEHYLVNKPVSPNPNTSENVFFPYNNGYQKINKNVIQFIKSSGSYVYIYIVNEPRPLLFTMNIGYIAQFFPAPNFHKLGRSYIVNLNHIDRFDKDHVYFKNQDEKVPIPQTKKQEFLRMIALVKTPRR